MLLGHATQDAIARQLNVTRKTIGADVKALRELWRQELVRDPVEVLARELAELNDMERDCVQSFTVSGDAVWLRERRLIKERKARMLGLDAPVRQEHTGPAGEPIKQDVTVLVNALANTDTRNALDALVRGVEGHPGSNGRHVV